MTETMGHCTPEMIEAYYDGTLTEAALAGVMAHLAECPECLEHAERVGDGLILMDAQIEETRQEAERAERLEEALSKAEARGTPVRADRIRHWRHRVAEGGMRSRRDPRQWRYALAGGSHPGQTVRTRGPIRTRSASAGPEPLEWLAGKRPSRIAVSKTQPVLIGLDEVPPGGLVALVPESGGGSAYLAEIAEQSATGPRWIARFEAVHPGEYTVVFE